MDRLLLHRIAFALLASGCSLDGGPCASDGAERIKGVCACPADKHFEQLDHEPDGRCVSNDRPAPSFDGGTRPITPEMAARTDGQAGRVEPMDSGAVDAHVESPNISAADAGISALDPGISAVDAGISAVGAGDVVKPVGDAGSCSLVSCPSDSILSRESCECVGGRSPTADAARPLCTPRTEECDGRDNDCDGVVDNGVSKNACGGCTKIEQAHAKGLACSNGGLGTCAVPGTYECLGETTVCNAPPASPSAEICDGKDNNCNGVIDDGAKNECGGACPLLGHAPGEPCTNGLKGACTAAGHYECVAGSIRCDAPLIKSTVGEYCNAIDDDCDGVVDNVSFEGADVWWVWCPDKPLETVHSCTKPPLPAADCKVTAMSS